MSASASAQELARTRFDIAVKAWVDRTVESAPAPTDEQAARIAELLQDARGH